MPKVFISYSHDSDTHREWVLDLSNRLREGGIDCEIDQYDPAPDQGWPVWMLQKMQDANYVLLVCTETYRKRFEQREEVGKGLGVTWEGMLVQNQLYRNASRSQKFIPIILQSTDVAYVPDAVYQYSHYDFSKPRTFEILYKHLRGELGADKPPLGKPHFQRTIHSDALPTVEGELFGRKDELALLDEALLDADTHVVQFVASGGTGKTKLLRHWLDDNHDKIEALIAWSFYSQGSSEDKQISATPFFIQALKSLRAGKDISDFNTEEEKGEYIADLLRERRCLLVLDGLEPLQQVGRGMRGELKDRAIRKMLRCLMGDHSSLCIITTRLPVHELKGRRRVVQHDLQNLAPEDGVALLRSFTEPYPVHGRDVDMLAAVEEYGRHALALHLLGNALATYLDGDVRKRDTLGELIGDYDDVERHAFKVMQAYEQWLEGTVELKLLYLLGLFDHPVEQEVLEVLWEAEIPGLTKGVERKAWLVARRDLLGKFRMMSEHEGRDDLFDCHPLIREYFGRQLKENEREVWRQTHTILYEYYKGLPEKLWGKYLPDTLEEMQPLFRAVAHGCAANLHQGTSDSIHWVRIYQENKAYILRTLGASNDDLAVIGHFFDKAWEMPSSNLDKNLQAVYLNRAAFQLNAVGRIQESLKPAELALNIFIDQRDWKQAARELGNLAEQNVFLGQLYIAQEKSKKGVYYSGKSRDAVEEIFEITTHADILHQLGKVGNSLKLFNESEEIQKKINSRNKFLFGLQGFQYCDLLLACNRMSEVFRRIQFTMKIAKDNNYPLDIALDFLNLSRYYFYSFKISDAREPLDQAKANFQMAGNQTYIPLYLLFSATLYRKTNQFSPAGQNLQETYEIAEPSGMRLHLTDYHLEMARLILAIEADPDQYKEATPDREQRTLPTELADPDEPGILTLEGHIQAADKLIQDTGYHRRDAELAELKQQAGMSC